MRLRAPAGTKLDKTEQIALQALGIIKAELGAENVGMVTGDASVNADAPIIAATAEILANMALTN